MCIVQYLPAVADEWIFETESLSLHSQWPSIEASSGPWVQALYSLSSPTPPSPQILAMFCREVIKNIHIILYLIFQHEFWFHTAECQKEQRWRRVQLVENSKIQDVFLSCQKGALPFSILLCNLHASRSQPEPTSAYDSIFVINLTSFHLCKPEGHW